jgi:hypothetical protein
MWLDGWIRSVHAGMGSSRRRRIGRDPGSPASPPHPSPPSPPCCCPWPRESCRSSLRGARSYIALPTPLLMLRWQRPAVHMLGRRQLLTPGTAAKCSPPPAAAKCSPKCNGGERESIFSSPLSSQCKMHSHLPRLLEVDLEMQSAVEEVNMELHCVVGVSLSLLILPMQVWPVHTDVVCHC